MKNKLAKIAGSVLVTVLFFYYFYKTVDFGLVAEYVKTVRWEWIAVAALSYCLTYPVRAFRIYYLTRNSGNHSFLQTQRICFRHQFFGRIIPFKVGDLSLVYLLKKAGVSVGEGGAVLLLIRLFDGVIIILSFLLCNLFVNMDVIPGWILLLVLALAIGAVFFTPFLLSRYVHLLQKLPEKLYRAVEQIRIMLTQSVATLKNVLVIGLVSLIMWFFVYLSMHGVVLAFSQPISFPQTVVASFLASAAAFLPINGIGGFGMVETGWTLGFTLLGMDRTVALSSGVVSNTMSFLIICLFGIISYIPVKRRNNNV
ncbi:MAG: flippase-like domain-containing protein [Ruminococcaceae bacterium]|nr:flippase-like domain-containing protein [Oscillospiraceae bacterium]